MKQLIEEYNNIYPAYASDGIMVSVYTFHEANNNGRPGTLQELTINGMNGVILPSRIVKDDTSIFTRAGSQNILKEDCDGIFFAEQEGKKYIYLCELKSSFSTQQITKAKDQIIGSYLKLHSLLSLLQSYNPDEWKVKGIIASFEPTLEQQAYIFKKEETGDETCRFCCHLYRDKTYPMPERNCKRFYSPLRVPELTFHHVCVPDKQTKFTIDFEKLEVGRSERQE